MTELDQSQPITKKNMTNIPSHTAYCIKAKFNYYYGTYRAPQDGYLTKDPKYDCRTGREICERLTFSSVKDAYDYLTADGYGCHPCGKPAVEYNSGCGDFSASGTYVTHHGQHSRPTYTIVSAKSGRSNKAIVAECEAINNQTKRDFDLL